LVLFKGNTVKRINIILDKAEQRKQKLESKVSGLQQEIKGLYEAVQDDFNMAILEDKEPSKRLAKDLEKAQKELEQAKFMLGQIDAVVQDEIEKQKKELEKERVQFVKDKDVEFNKIFHEMNQLKIAYLEKVIEYRKQERQMHSDYSRTFRNIEKRLGMNSKISYFDNKLSINQRHQITGRYSPMITPNELRVAFVEENLAYDTEKNKDAFK
jgi:hypothetical protein